MLNMAIINFFIIKQKSDDSQRGVISHVVIKSQLIKHLITVPNIRLKIYVKIIV